MNFIVNIDHLSDRELSFFGWVKVDDGDEFSLYWNPRYNEFQPISNDPPRMMLVDDYNDAHAMAQDEERDIIEGPRANRN